MIYSKTTIDLTIWGWMRYILERPISWRLGEDNHVWNVLAECVKTAVSKG